MKLFDKYLIVSDMDGTFFGERGSIVPENVKAIEYFRQNGGLFTLSTGRNKPVLEFAYPMLHEFISGPAVLCNGCYLYDFQKKELRNETVISQDELIRLLQKTKALFPEIGYRISTNVGFVTDNFTPFIQERLLKFLPITQVGPLHSFQSLTWHKICFSAPAEEIQKLTEYFKSNPINDCFRLTTSDATLLEILPRGISKAVGIKHLRNYYPERTIICVGDYDNDLEMLREADVAACPENALDLIKEISTIQLCHHTKGCIADLIYKLDASTKE